MPDVYCVQMTRTVYTMLVDKGCIDNCYSSKLFRYCVRTGRWKTNDTGKQSCVFFSLVTNENKPVATRSVDFARTDSSYLNHHRIKPSGFTREEINLSTSRLTRYFLENKMRFVAPTNRYNFARLLC